MQRKNLRRPRGVGLAAGHAQRTRLSPALTIVTAASGRGVLLYDAAQRDRTTTMTASPFRCVLDLKASLGTDLNDGPAWWPVTGRPGGGDTVAIAGHRTTYTRPFYWLERLRPGNAIYVRWAGRMHAYSVTGRRILSAKQLHIADARGYEVLLLSACTPRGSARQRIVVYARPRV